MMKKIFFIGFSKCGTTSLSALMQKSGIKSAHFIAKGKNIAELMVTNISLCRPALFGLERFQAFSDMSFASSTLCIDGCRFFKTLDRDYPGSYFVLNTRPVDHWIASRRKHTHHLSKETLIGRVAKASSQDHEGVLDSWRTAFITHHAEVRSYFEGNTKFLEFDIENDPVERIQVFLQDSYDIDIAHWGKQNSQASREALLKRS